MPPHAYVIQRRLEHATKLMIETDASLSEIAIACGFGDQAHLSRRFRAQTGVTPAAWRRAQKAGQYFPAAGTETDTSRPQLNGLVAA